MITLAVSMKESRFVEQNKTKWSKFDDILKQSKPDPVDLNRLFVELSDDLSYARSRYRNRSVRVYLNWMMQRIYNRLYRRKSIRWQDVKSFFRDEIPFIMYLSRKYMIISLVVFLLGATIGVVSSYHDPSFSTLILGEEYVEVTLDNIASGDPMRIYKSAFPEDGFIMILNNNARIDVTVFATGLLMGIFSLFFLVKNAVMVGVFQFFFYQHGGFTDSVLTIWMHGAIEISTIVLICGAGLLAGSGWMFPGTRTRFQAFRISGLKAAKLLVAILPFTLLAAFIEAFITPLELPAVINILFILLTFGVMVFYFVWYPYYRYRGTPEKGRFDVYLPYVSKPDVNPGHVRRSGELVVDTFYLYGSVIGKLIPWALLSVGLIMGWYYYQWGASNVPEYFYSAFPLIQYVLNELHMPNIGLLFRKSGSIQMLLIALSTAGLTFLTVKGLRARYGKVFNLTGDVNFAVLAGLGAVAGCTLLLTSGYALLQFTFLLLVVLCSMLIGYGIDKRREGLLRGKFVAVLGSGFWSLIGVFILLLIISKFLFLIVQSPLVLLLKQLFLDSLGNVMINSAVLVMINMGISLFVLFMICPLFIIAGILVYFNAVEKRFSVNIRSKLKELDLI